MALLHRATLTPSKLELAGGWTTAQPWFVGDGDLRLVANFRFDDPLGEVGVETLLIQAGDGPVLQVPLTYRNEALPGADQFLIGTLEHSVLGTRWVYDALGDPVYLQTLATTVHSGGTQVEMWIDEGAGLVQRAPTATVRGGGSSADYRAPLAPVGSFVVDDAAGNAVSSVRAEGVSAIVVRRPDEHQGTLAGELLVGAWVGHPDEVRLAAVSVT